MAISNTGTTRRKMMFHTASAAGLVAAGIVAAMAADPSNTDPGPANSPLDRQNADSTWPPATDSKILVQNFKYPFSFANKRTYKGGWSREVTVRELPVSKDMAGGKMRAPARGGWGTKLENGGGMGGRGFRGGAVTTHCSARTR